MKHPRLSVFSFSCWLSLALVASALAAPSAHAAASLPAKLQGTYTLTKKGAVINGVADSNPKYPSPRPTFTVRASGFIAINGAKLSQLLAQCGDPEPAMKLKVVMTSTTAFTATASGSFTFVVRNPDPHKADQPVTIPITIGSIKGTISASGMTFSGSATGYGKAFGKAERFAVTFTLELKK
jgi:hypothetical protein